MCWAAICWPLLSALSQLPRSDSFTFIRLFNFLFLYQSINQPVFTCLRFLFSFFSVSFFSLSFPFFLPGSRPVVLLPRAGDTDRQSQAQRWGLPCSFLHRSGHIARLAPHGGTSDFFRTDPSAACLVSELGETRFMLPCHCCADGLTRPPPGLPVPPLRARHWASGHRFCPRA